MKREKSNGILQQSINMQPFEVNITQEILAKAIERIIEDSFTEERNALIKKQESIDYFNSKKGLAELRDVISLMDDDESYAIKNHWFAGFMLGKLWKKLYEAI